jgi:hypothetical protein
MKFLISTIAAVLLATASPATAEEKSIGFFLFTGVVVSTTGAITSETAYFSKRQTCLLAKGTFNYAYRPGMGLADSDGIMNNRVAATFTRCVDLTGLLANVRDLDA